MDYDQLIRDANEFELNRRAEFDSDMNIPLGILTVMSGFWYSLADRISSPLSLANYCSVVLLTFCALSIIIAAVQLWRAHVGIKYKVLATAKKLDDHYETIKAWGVKEGLSKEEIQAALFDYVRETLVESAQRNAEINEKRSVRILQQKKMLGVGLAILALAGLVQLVSDFNHEQKMETHFDLPVSLEFKN
jgi:hypothetical protein